jgi:hypothetical protein
MSFTTRTKEDVEQDSKPKENIIQREPLSQTSENDEVVGGNFLDLEHIKNPKHKQLLRDLSDFIDYRRGKIPEDFMIGIFTDKGNKVIQPVTNTMSSDDINKKLYIDSDFYLYDPVKISFIASDNSKYNENISMLIDDNKKIDHNLHWKGPIGEDVRIGLRLSELSYVSGVAITFPDATKQQYKFNLKFVNEDNDIVSELIGIESSKTTNQKQIIGLANILPDIDRVTIDFTVGDDEEFEPHVYHINVLRDINRELLKDMNKHDIVSYQYLENPVFVKKDNTKINIDENPTKE